MSDPGVDPLTESVYQSGTLAIMTDAEEHGLKMAAAKARDAARHRDGLIVAAVKRGASLREVAALVGLGHSTVARIASNE